MLQGENVHAYVIIAIFDEGQTDSALIAFSSVVKIYHVNITFLWIKLNYLKLHENNVQTWSP